MTRPAHRPPNPHTAAGVALVAAGLTPEEAAEQLTEQLQATLPRGSTEKDRRGARISGKTIRRAMASGAAPPRPGTARGDQPPGRLSSESRTIPTHGMGASKAFHDGEKANKIQKFRGDAWGATAPRLSPGARRSSRVIEEGSPASTGAQGGDESPSPTGGDPRVSGPGPSLPPAKLSELRELIGRLPFAQQDHLVATLPLERVRREAIARGIAPFHEAAAAVARELRAVRL